MKRKTFFETPSELRPNHLPEMVHKMIDRGKVVSPLYRVVDFYADMFKIPPTERTFGMLVTVVNDPIKKLNATYIFLDVDSTRNFGNNKNWQVFKNTINEVLGINGEYFEDVSELVIVHGMNRWPILYALIDTEGNEISGRVKFIDNNMFRVEFDLEPVTGYMFYYV